jgi:hypothetical protein
MHCQLPTEQGHDDAHHICLSITRESPANAAIREINDPTPASMRPVITPPQAAPS